MITIETINGEKRLVVWDSTPYIAGYLTWINLPFGMVAIDKSAIDVDPCLAFLAIALPALPCYPKNDEATIRLLSLYRAHGIDFEMCVTLKSGVGIFRNGLHWWELLADDRCKLRIDRARYNGEQIELVFEGDE